MKSIIYSQQNKKNREQIDNTKTITITQAIIELEEIFAKFDKT